MKIMLSPRTTSLAIAVTAGYCLLHWLLFVHFDATQANITKQLAADILGQPLAGLARETALHLPTLLFAWIGYIVWQLRTVRPTGQATGYVVRQMDTFAHWLIPMAFGLIVLDRMSIVSMLTPGDMFGLRWLSFQFSGAFREVLAAASADTTIWGFVGEPRHAFYAVPFAHYLTSSSLGQILSGLLPFVALFALGRKTRALSRLPLPPRHGGTLTAVSSPKGKAPPEFLPHG